MKKGAAYWMDLQQFDDKDPIFLAKNIESLSSN